MSNLVDSVEFIEHTFSSSATLSSGVLSKDQDITNCVPFVSWYGNTNYPDGQFFDVWFDYSNGDPYIYFQRTNSRSTDLYLKIDVVEFDPAKVKVYQGELPSPISTTETGTTVSGGPYNQVRSGLKFYHRTEASSDIFNHHLIRGQLTTNSGTYGDELTFSRRYSTTDATYGHYYIFESLNDDFGVTHNTGTLAGGITLYFDTYDWHNSFLLSSYCGTDTDSGDVHQTTIRSYLWANAAIGINKHDATSSVYYNTQLITFDNAATASGTYYCPKITSYHTMAAGTTERTLSLAIPITSPYATIISVQNPTRCAVTDLSYQSDAFNAVWLTESGTQFKIKRATSDYIAYPTYYVVDWGGQMVPEYPSTGVVSGTLDSSLTPVKSVENISTVISEHVSNVHLSKGQDVSNCIVFKSGWADKTSSYDQVYQHEVMTYFRGNELYLERGNEGWDHYSELSVVEFYPDQVKVQQGTFIIERDTSSVSVTIDSITTSKTFLVFGNFFGDSDDIWAYHLVRGRIVDSTTLTFSRGKIHTLPIMGTWYLAEDLGDTWYVRHYNSSSSTANRVTVEWDQHYSQFNTFNLMSSDTSGTLDDPDEFTWQVYYHSPLVPARAEKVGSSYPNIVSFQTVNFIDESRVRVQYKSAYITTTESSLTYDLPDEMATSSGFSPIWNNLNSISRVSSTDALANIHAYSRIQYLPETNQITQSRQYSGVSDSSGGTTYNIDWEGYISSSGGKAYSSFGYFIKSIEKFTYTGTSRRISWTPSKSQDLSNCLPIVTWSMGEDSGDDPERFMYAFWFWKAANTIDFQSYWGGNNPGIDAEMSLLEFDPAQVRVQHGTGHMHDGNTTDTAVINEVDTSKAFIIVYGFPSDNVGIYLGSAMISARFSTTTELAFQRGKNAGNIHITWFVVECLQDQWEVDHSEILTSNVTYFDHDFSNSTPSDKTISVASIAMGQTTMNPAYGFYRMYPSADLSGVYRIRVNRQTANVAVNRMNVSKIAFSEDSKVLVTSFHYYFGTTENSKTYDMGHSVDVNKTIIFNGLSFNTMRTNTLSATSGSQRGFAKVSFVDENTLAVDRAVDAAAVEAWGHVYIIEFDLPTHIVSGVVREKGTFVSRNLNLHRTDTGELVGSTMSSGIDGTYELATSYSGSSYVVCLDDALGTAYNGLIETDIYPTTASGSAANDGGA